jgi:chemosensory pili system protein ChpA (sensor histidine kinase/response regulator)
LQLSQASAEEIDAELLDIFLEEARDVLSVVDSKLKLLREQASNVEALTHLRRSFHTLKGSGRMVGLRDLGDVAWAVEQCLNLWLRQELAVAAPLLEMLDLASAVFLSWVEHLDGKAATAPDAGRLLALCLALRQSNESAQEIAAQIVTEAARPAATVAPSPVEATPQPSAEVIPFAPPPRSTEAPDFANKLAAELGSADEILELPDFDLPAIPASPAELEVSLEPICEAAPAVPVEPPEALAEVPVIEPLPQPETADFAEASAGSALEPPSLTELGSEPVTPVAPPGQPRISVSATLYEIFLEEAEVHLATLQRELGELEIDTSKSAHPEMRRAAHTLGGIAGTVGLMPINQLGLALEHALLRRSKLPDTVRAAQAAAGSSVESLETFGRAIAELGRMLGVLKVRGQPEEATSLIGALDALYASPFDEQLACESGGLTALEPAQVPVEAHKETPKVVSEEVRLEVHEKAHEDAHEAAPEEVPEAAPAAPAGVAAPAFAAPKVVDELDEQLLPIFLEEALDLNQKIAAKLRAWRSNPADGEVAHTLARLLHNLKGSARMAGAMQLGEITHAIESRVEETRRTGIAPLELIDEIDGAFDAISQIVDRLLRGESLEPTSALEDSAQNIAELVAKPEAGLAIAQAKRATPPAPAGEAGRESAAELATLRVRADLIDRLVNDAGELSIARSRIEGEMRGLKDSLLDLTENVIRLRRQMREIEIQAESQMQSRTAQTDEQHPGFDPLELDRFSRFQELTRMMSESVNDVGTVQQILLKNVDEANAAILAQARLNRELQQELMNVRMVPFISISDRLYRIVRQTAKELGKRANLEIKGGQLEIDRSVLDKMAAPLEHILRNAIAHGLETHETRSAQGKPDIGEIVLSLTQEGNQIVLSLSDDGAGLDFQRVRERAIAAGLLAPDQATDTAALVDLIFAPGLSTADELSQIAGRGVGLDVVKTEVTSLGGRIEVGSTPGVGTEFRLYIPLTLALTQALLVRAGSKVYAIPSVMIAQLLDLKEAALKLIKEAGEVEWMGQRYPFGYLPNLLGDPAAQPEVHRKSWVLLLRSGDQRIAVQIDEPRGNQEIVVKNIGPQLARVPGIDGATVLGNGQVVLILNPIALTRRLPTIAFAADASAAPETVTASAAVALVPTIMVVDDSLTVRKFTSRLLVREGYNVITAKDGVEALEHLVEVVPDVMLVDIEMPRMDGFDLTRNIRTDERLKDIPIIIITSRAAEKHRNYAFEIGVNQYLGKPYREDELLQLVGRYVKAQPKDAPVA